MKVTQRLTGRQWHCCNVMLRLQYMICSTYLLLFFFLLFLLGGDLFKSFRLRRFISGRDDIWQDCSSSKCSSTDRVGFPIWRHTFKMAAMTLFHATKCCYLVSQSARSVCRRLCSSVRQFLIYSAFVLVCRVADDIVVWLVLSEAWRGERPWLMKSASAV